jgi:hypothetical protein
METVTINSRIKKNNKTELYQTLESLKPNIKSHCKELRLKINPDDSLNLQITFDDHESLQNNFYNAEFNILKGTIKSLCDNVVIKINDESLSKEF